MATIQIKNGFITSSAAIVVSSSLVQFQQGVKAKSFTGSFSGSFGANQAFVQKGNTINDVSASLGTINNKVLSFKTNNTSRLVISGSNITATGTITSPQIINTNNAIAASGNAATVPITSRLSTVTNNSAATLTITITTTSAVDGQQIVVRVLDFSAVSQTITWVNTENSTVTVPAASNGSTTLPVTVGFMFNSRTSLWRCCASC